MRATYAMWATPRSLRAWIRQSDKREILESLNPLLARYIDTACKPLLAVPVRERERLPMHVTQFAVASWETRYALLAKTFEALGNNVRQIVDFSGELKHILEGFREQSVHLFRKDYIDCFEFGTGLYLQIIQKIAPRLESEKWVFSMRPDQISSWYEWVHATICLDLCATSVLWYLEEDRDPSRSEIAEELCFLVKEYALTYAACARTLLAAPTSGHPKKQVVLSEEDQRWDRDFCNLTLSDVQRHLAPS